jgi:hypothetical protein
MGMLPAKAESKAATGTKEQLTNVVGEAIKR